MQHAKKIYLSYEESRKYLSLKYENKARNQKAETDRQTDRIQKTDRKGICNKEKSHSFRLEQYSLEDRIWGAVTTPFVILLSFKSD